MGTTSNFDTPAASSVVLTDTVPIISTATGRGATATVAQLMAGTAAVVNTTATVLAVTQAAHAGRVVTVSSTVPIAITLPATAGTGAKYVFQVQVAATAAGHTVKVANTVDIMQGISWCLTTASDAVIGYKATSADDTITINGTTKGGVVGDIIELTDVKTGFWSVKMFSSPTGSTATPFSASV